MKILTKLPLVMALVLSSVLLSPAFANETKQTNNTKTELTTVRDIPAGTTCLDRSDVTGDCKRLLDPKTTTIYRKANEKWLYEEHDSELARKLSQP